MNLFILRSGDRVPLHCVDRHPNQQHIVATGGQDGMLCVWDMRQGSAPFSLMEAHSAESTTSQLLFVVFTRFSRRLLFWFFFQCGKSTSIQPTRTICSRAQKMGHFCTGRLLHILICLPIYKVKQVIHKKHVEITGIISKVT